MFSSIFAVGRGGIVSIGFLLCIVLIINIRNISGELLNSRRKKALYILILFFFVLCGYFWGDANVYEKLFGRFFSLGMNNHGRFDIWISYYHKTFENIVYIMEGAPISDIPYIFYRYAGNLHNSILNIHAFNGLISVIIVFLFAIQTIFSSIKKKQFLFLSCFIAITFRGLTDQVFWGTVGTPVFMFFLLKQD